MKRSYKQLSGPDAKECVTKAVIAQNERRVKIIIELKEDIIKRINYRANYGLFNCDLYEEEYKEKEIVNELKEAGFLIISTKKERTTLSGKKEYDSFYCLNWDPSFDPKDLKDGSFIE